MNFTFGVLVGLLVGALLAFFIALGLEPLLAEQVKSHYGSAGVAVRGHFVPFMVVDYIVYVGLVLTAAYYRDLPEFRLGVWLAAPVPAFVFVYMLEGWHI